MPLFEVPAATRARTSRSRAVSRTELRWTIRFTVLVMVAPPPTARPSALRPAPFAHVDLDRLGLAAAAQSQFKRPTWDRLGQLRGKALHVIDRHPVDRFEQIPWRNSGC